MLTVDPHGDAAEVPGDPVAAKRSAKTYGRKREPARGEGGRPEEPPAAREPPTRVRADAALHDVSADSLLDLLDGDAPRSAADGSEDALSEPAENNESESSAAAKDASSKGKKKRRKRILGSSSSEASPVAIKKALPAALPSESDAGDAGSPKDENPPADPEADLGSSQMMPSQPLDPNMDLELHFSDQEELEEEIRRDAENDRRKREAMGLEDDAPIPEIPDDSQVPGEGGEGKAGSASDADAGSGSDDGARKGKHRRLKKLNQKELKELHRESDRLKRTGVVSLEMTVARQLNMRDFLSRFGAGKPKDKQAAPAVESAPSNGAPTVDDLADGVKSGTDGPGGVVPMPHKPALAKAAVIELDDDDPLPARPRAPASRPAAKRVDAVSSLKAKRNAELAKQAELHALRQKEQYKKQKEQVLAAKRAQEKADDRLGMKSGKKGQRPAQGAEPAAETPPEKGEGDAQSEKRDSDLDSGDEDIVNAGLPESERRGKRKLHRKHAVVPPAYADLDYLAQPAVVSDLNARLDTKRETAKELKAKAAQREKAKLEAARALGKKGNDIRSFFAGPKAADPVKPAATLHKSGKSGEPGSETDMFAEDRSDRDDGGDEDAASDGGSGADVDSQDEEGLSEGSAEETGEESSGESEGSDADADADAGEDAPSEPNEGESSIASPSGPASEAPISDTQAAGDDDDEVIVKPKSKKNKSMFVLNEAEEEEDEFQGLGGPDGEDSDDDDGKDLADLIATGKDAEDHAPEELDAILRQHRAELAAKDQEEVNQLLKDVTSGNLRKRGRTGLDGRYLDDDSEDEDLELLKAIRLANDLQRRYGPGKRKRGDDMSVVEKLASNPETAAFGKAFLGDTADKSGFLDWEERKSDAVGVVSTDSAHQSEDDDQYEEDDMERSDEDASSEADTKFT
ncbi:MRC1-like domain-containing protein [Hyaloraphidium curvatum]|nr:MRC1-like domain-containing protein [Hyaloraphidium curvatum]